MDDETALKLRAMDIGEVIEILEAGGSRINVLAGTSSFINHFSDQSIGGQMPADIFAEASQHRQEAFVRYLVATNRVDPGPLAFLPRGE